MSSELLYQLLPEVYRYRDYYEGQPLRALMAVLQQVFDAVQLDFVREYDNWFIETCEPRIVPYIGDLLGLHLPESATPIPDLRTHVGKAIAYRRAKGTREALQLAARAATGWECRVVEYRERLAITQDLLDPTPWVRGTADLRQPGSGLTNGPFDHAPHNVSIRSLKSHVPLPAARIGPLPNRYSVADIGLFVWRLEGFEVTAGETTAWRDFYYLIHPLGVDSPLFNRHSGAVSRLQLERILLSGYDPLFRIWVRESVSGPVRQIPPARIFSGHLDKQPETGAGWEEIDLIVDPVLGRLYFPHFRPITIEVTYLYGFSGDFGGGPYDRYQTLAAIIAPPGGSVWQADVCRDVRPETQDVYSSLAQAVRAWMESGASGPDGVIRIQDSAVYFESSLEIDVGERTLVIEARNGERPVLRGDIGVTGAGSGKLTLSGLWIAGQLEARGAVEITLTHCTLRPGHLAVLLGDGANPVLRIEFTIVGGLHSGNQSGDVRITDSILDGGSAAAIDCSGGRSGLAATFNNCTVLGPVHVGSLDLACSSIFAGVLAVDDCVQGCIRHSWIPPGSKTPARYNCLEPGAPPEFVSEAYGAPGYCQLSLRCPDDFLHGGENDSEIGVFHSLRQTSRWKQLRKTTEESIPFGLNCQIFCEN